MRAVQWVVGGCAITTRGRKYIGPRSCGIFGAYEKYRKEMGSKGMMQPWCCRVEKNRGKKVNRNSWKLKTNNAFSPSFFFNNNLKIYPRWIDDGIDNDGFTIKRDDELNTHTRARKGIFDEFPRWISICPPRVSRLNKFTSRRSIILSVSLSQLSSTLKIVSPASKSPLFILPNPVIYAICTFN